MTDPFAAHPELRPLIVESKRSAMRNLYEAARERSTVGSQQFASQLRSLKQQEIDRRSVLADHKGDLWVFAYGSLMWDPAIEFLEVRRAWLPGYARRFILCDIHGARGTREVPGLMAALDRGEGCNGLAFRISNERVEEETRNLWVREMTIPSYIPKLLPVQLYDKSVVALVFLADHDAEMIRPDLTREQQVRFLSTGFGFLGSSRDYLETIARHFSALGIDDSDVTSFSEDVCSLSHGHR